MAGYHLHADASGETHLSELVLPEKETPAGVVRGIEDIPTLTAGMAAFVDRKPSQGMHGAPLRQFLIILRGQLEVVTSLEQRAVLDPGDVLFADDVDSKGHLSLDVGAEPLAMMRVGVTDSWAPDQPPDARP